MNILDTIGNTPVLHLKSVKDEASADVYGKYEAGNPSFSIKDRTALAMIKQAEQNGTLKADTVIVDATAGNTGVALAMVCAVKKLKLRLFMPESASLERRKMLEGFGATLTLTPSAEGITGAITRATEFVATQPNTISMNQFNNPAAVKAHEETTAEEIIKDFPDSLDALVLGVGTGASLTGVGNVLRKKFPQLLIVAVEPATSAVLSGKPAGLHRIQQLGHGFVPGNLDRNLIDEVYTVTDTEAYNMTRHLSRHEGLLVGISSGANVHAATAIAKKVGKNKKILTFLCDGGQRYFSLYSEPCSREGKAPAALPMEGAT